MSGPNSSSSSGSSGGLGEHDHVSDHVEVERARPTLVVRAPLALALLGAAVIGLLALFYVHEVTSLTAANDELHRLQAEQTRLERQDAQLHAQLGEVTSPAYIDRHARAAGLTPNGADTPVTVVTVNNSGAGDQP